MPFITVEVSTDMVERLLQTGHEIRRCIISKGLPEDARLIKIEPVFKSLRAIYKPETPPDTCLLTFRSELIDQDEFTTIEVTTIRTVGEPTDFLMEYKAICLAYGKIIDIPFPTENVETVVVREADPEEIMEYLESIEGVE